MLITIISQDRSTFWEGDKSELKDSMASGAKLYGDLIMGINLYIAGKMMGTFESVERVQEEMACILMCPQREYYVCNFDDEEVAEELGLDLDDYYESAELNPNWQDWETLKDAMRGEDDASD